MNVLYNIDIQYPRLHHGGVLNYIKKLFKFINRDKFTPLDLYLLSNFSFNKHYSIFNLQIYRRLRLLKSLVFFNTLLCNGKIHILHLNPSLSWSSVQRDLFFAQKSIKFGIPFVLYFRGWNKNYEQNLSINSKKLNKFVYYFGKADRILVLASEFKNRLIEWGISENKILLETVMIDDYMLMDLDIIEHRGQHFGNIINLLFLSRIEKSKGIYETVDTYALLKSHFPSIKLTIAGEGSELENLKKYVQNLEIKDIDFLGWVDGPAKQKAYMDADIFLFPSYGEGMPNTVLEAMAYGLPIIVPPVGGIPDFFQDLKMGFLAKSIDPEHLKGLCESLIQDQNLRRNIGVFNHEYAVKNFLASQVTRRIEAIYTQVIEERRGSEAKW